MRVPKRLQPLVEDGLVDEVIRPLMSGKEASVLVVSSGGEVRCAKVYKEANNRSFRARVDYEEGRGVRNSRRARAMAKRSKFGKAQLEEAWQSTEVDTIYKLERAGVRVPKPYTFSSGVLIMELVVDAQGHAAPRLSDVRLSPERARTYHAFMLDQVKRMLCAGLIHGDLSGYNVLVGSEGPVVIDFPQAVDAAANQGAKRMFLRDVDNMRATFGRFARELNRTDYGKEMWKLYERGELQPDTELTGLVEEETAKANVGSVLDEIEEARAEHDRRTRLRVVDIAPSDDPPRSTTGARPHRGQGGSTPAGAHVNGQGGAPRKRRRRRRRKPGNGATSQATDGRQATANRPPTGAPATGALATAAGPPKKRRRRRRRKPANAGPPL